MLTADEFIKREMSLYGEDEIWNLIDKGYVPTLTSEGWRWKIASHTKLRVDNGTDFCYNRGAEFHSYSRSDGIAVVGVMGD